MRSVVESDTPEGTLKEMLKRAELLDGVIVLGLNKDGTQLMLSSQMSMMEKNFLVSFAQSWVMEWFHHENIRGE